MAKSPDESKFEVTDEALRYLTMSTIVGMTSVYMLQELGCPNWIIRILFR